MAYLFDSSSIYMLVKANKPEVLAQEYTCALARYETGNILVTETNVRKTINETEQKSLLNIILRTLNVMHILEIKKSEQETLNLATKYSLSFYDASYVYLAKSFGITLITEDGKLGKKIKGYIETKTAEELS